MSRFFMVHCVNLRTAKWAQFDKTQSRELCKNC